MQSTFKLRLTSAESDTDLENHEAFHKRQTKPGVSAEVGAARSDYVSISANFRQIGRRIVAVEPNPAFCAEHRPKGFNVHQYACSGNLFLKDSYVDYMRGRGYALWKRLEPNDIYVHFSAVS